MFRINSEGFVVDSEDGEPVALVAHNCVAVEATKEGRRYLLLRFDCQRGLPGDALLSTAQLHQYALPLEQAGDLVQAILSIAQRDPDQTA